MNEELYLPHFTFKDHEAAPEIHRLSYAVGSLKLG
jgi:hypothetical protein